MLHNSSTLESVSNVLTEKGAKRVGTTRRADPAMQSDKRRVLDTLVIVLKYS